MKIETLRLDIRIIMGKPGAPNPLWTVDPDVVVPSPLAGKEHYYDTALYGRHCRVSPPEGSSTS